MNELKQELLNLGIFIDNEYLDEYCLLIITNSQTECIKGVTEKHHIIQRAYFKANNLPIDNSPKNIVILTHFDHCLAHYYLCLCTNKIFEFKNQYALLKMVKIKRFEDFDFDEFISCADKYNDIYSAYILNQQQNAIIRWAIKKKDVVQKRYYTNGVTEVCCEKCPDGFHLGRLSAHEKHMYKEIICIETKEKFKNIYELKDRLNCKYMSSILTVLKHPHDISLYGNHYCYIVEYTDDFIINIHKSGCGHKYWVTNGLEEKMILKTECVPDGWYKGRLKSKFTNVGGFTKGQHCYTDGTKCIYAFECPDGFVPSYANKKIPTEETKLKQSISAKKRYEDPEERKRLSKSLQGRPGTVNNKIWINDGYQEKYQSKDLPIPDGWMRGRCPKSVEKNRQAIKNYKEKLKNEDKETIKKYV